MEKYFWHFHVFIFFIGLIRVKEMKFQWSTDHCNVALLNNVWNRMDRSGVVRSSLDTKEFGCVETENR